MDWQAAFIQRAVDAYPNTFWVNAPQDQPKPYATLLDVTELRPDILNGPDIEFARVQIDVWGKSYSAVQTGMETLLAALRPGATSNGHIFLRAAVALGPRDIGGEREGQETIYRKSADLTVAHRPA